MLELAPQLRSGGAKSFGASPMPHGKAPEDWDNQTRVVRTYDFIHFRDLVSAENTDLPPTMVPCAMLGAGQNACCVGQAGGAEPERPR